MNGCGCGLLRSSIKVQVLFHTLLCEGLSVPTLPSSLPSIYIRWNSKKDILFVYPQLKRFVYQVYQWNQNISNNDILVSPSESMGDRNSTDVAVFINSFFLSFSKILIISIFIAARHLGIQLLANGLFNIIFNPICSTIIIHFSF